MRFQFERELYPKVALLKAAYNYTDRAFVHLDADEKYFYVDIEKKDSELEFNEEEFANEMLAQAIRHEIYLQTKNIRELMLARAMASTIVTDTEPQDMGEESNQSYAENEILRDWFSKDGED